MRLVCKVSSNPLLSRLENVLPFFTLRRKTHSQPPTLTFTKCQRFSSDNNASFTSFQRKTTISWWFCMLVKMTSFKYNLLEVYASSMISLRIIKIKAFAIGCIQITHSVQFIDIFFFDSSFFIGTLLCKFSTKDLQQ